MTNVKGISPESAINQVNRGQVSKSQTSQEIEKEISTEKSVNKDSLQVDEKQRKTAQFIEDARLLLEELPEIRQDRITQAKQRLQDGYYDRPEILKETAKTILEGLSPNNEPYTVKIGDKLKENIDRINSRLESGYYDQEDVLDETARRIIKKNP